MREPLTDMTCFKALANVSHPHIHDLMVVAICMGHCLWDPVPYLAKLRRLNASCIPGTCTLIEDGGVWYGDLGKWRAQN